MPHSMKMQGRPKGSPTDCFSALFVKVSIQEHRTETFTITEQCSRGTLKVDFGIPNACPTSSLNLAFQIGVSEADFKRSSISNYPLQEH